MLLTLIVAGMILAQNPPQASGPGSPPPPEGWKVDDNSKNGPLTIPFGKPGPAKKRVLKKKISPGSEPTP
jgi:hypothetical protein